MAPKKKKEPVNSLAGWAEIFQQQSDQNLIKDYRAELDELIANKKAAAKLFHQVWGEAHDSPDYNKKNWIELQTLLKKLDIPV